MLSGDIEWLDSGEANQLCAALERAPGEVFGPGAAALVTPAAPAPVTPLPQDSDIVRRIKTVSGALADEVAIEAAERSLDGRKRVTWVERRLDELTDLFRPLPADHSPAVAVAATYRQMVRSEGSGSPSTTWSWTARRWASPSILPMPRPRAGALTTKGEG